MKKEIVINDPNFIKIAHLHVETWYPYTNDTVNTILLFVIKHFAI